MIDENAHIFTRYEKIISFELSLELSREWQPIPKMELI